MMTARHLTPFIAAVLLPTLTVAEVLPAETRYICDRGAQVQAVYINPADSAGLAVLHVEDQLVVLQNAPAASGAFYTSGEAAGYRWHVKGNEAFLTYLAEGQGEETVLLHNCVVVP